MQWAKVNKREVSSMAKKKSKPSLYQIKVSLMDSPLPVWRRLIIPSDTQLELVHLLMQVSFGWANSHLHEFKAGQNRYGQMEFAEEDPELLDECEYTLEALFSNPGSTATYRYDFGDCWDHKLLLEKVSALAEGELLLGRCTAGKRACPPEDVGGPSGYERFLSIIEDPQHEERGELLEWIGSEFDPDSFDARLVNLQIRMIENDIVEDFAELMASKDLAGLELGVQKSKK